MFIPKGLAFLTWQLPSGPDKIYARVFLSHAAVSSRVFAVAPREAPPLVDVPVRH